MQATRANQVEEDDDNWDDDFEFGSTISHNGVQTPPNRSPRASFSTPPRSAFTTPPRNAFVTPPKNNRRWSGDSWDEDETVSLSNRGPWHNSTPKQRPQTSPQKGRSVTAKLSRASMVSDPIWSEEEDTSNSKLVPRDLAPGSSTSKRSPSVPMPVSSRMDPAIQPSNHTPTSIFADETMEMSSTSDSSVLPQSDASSTGGRESNTFLSRLTRRWSRSGSKMGMESQPSPSSSFTGSPNPTSIFTSSNLQSNAIGSPSKPRGPFGLGSSLKRNTSLTKSKRQSTSTNGELSSSSNAKVVSTAPPILDINRYPSNNQPPSSYHRPQATVGAKAPSGHTSNWSGGGLGLLGGVSGSSAGGLPPSPTKKSRQGNGRTAVMLTSLQYRQPAKESLGSTESPGFLPSLERGPASFGSEKPMSQKEQQVFPGDPVKLQTPPKMKRAGRPSHKRNVSSGAFVPSPILESNVSLGPSGSTNSNFSAAPSLGSGFTFNFPPPQSQNSNAVLLPPVDLVSSNRSPKKKPPVKKVTDESEDNETTPISRLLNKQVDINPSNTTSTMTTPASDAQASLEISMGISRGSQIASASLGRFAGNVVKTSEDDQERDGEKRSGIGRRNSLGNVISLSASGGPWGGQLKIPAHIRMKQDDLKRDLIAVREFSSSINDIKQLQSNYRTLLSKLYDATSTPSKDASAGNAQESPSKLLYKMRSTSPIPQYHIPRPPAGDQDDPQDIPHTPPSPIFLTEQQQKGGRWPSFPQSYSPLVENFPGGLSSNIQLSDEQCDATRGTLREIDSHYSIWWECADLLVELGGAAPPTVAGNVMSPTPSNQNVLTSAAVKKSAGLMFEHDYDATPRQKKGKLHPAEFPSSPKPPQDLNARQVLLLQEMLKTPDPNNLSSSMELTSGLYAMMDEDVSPAGRPNGSVATLGSQTTDPVVHFNSEERNEEKAEKKSRRASRVGKLGVKDILASLKWTKAKMRSREAIVGNSPRKSVDFTRGTSNDAVGSLSKAPFNNTTPTGKASKDNLNVKSPQKSPPSPYKRSRRRSIASIFKFSSNSNPLDEDHRSRSRSRSRVDLADTEKKTGERGGDIDSDWDRMSSPSDVPGYSRLAIDRSEQEDDPFIATSPLPIPLSPTFASQQQRRNVSGSAPNKLATSPSSASLGGNSMLTSSASVRSSDRMDGDGERRRRLRKSQKNDSTGAFSSYTGRKSSSRPSSSRTQKSDPSSSSVQLVDIPVRAYHTTRSVSNHSVASSHQVFQAASKPSATLDSSTPAPQRLAMTPENIVPLLIYAKEVKLRIGECLQELRIIENDVLGSKGAN